MVLTPKELLRSITSKELAELLNPLKLNDVKSINLGRLNLDYAQFETLCRLIAQNKVNALDMGHTSFEALTTWKIQTFSNALSLTTSLKELLLYNGCELRSLYLPILARGLKENTSVTNLKLYPGYSTSQEALVEFFTVLTENTTLTKLVVRDISINNPLMMTIRDMLVPKNTPTLASTLKTLKFHNVKFEDDSVDNFEEMIPPNCPIRNFKFHTGRTAKRAIRIAKVLPRFSSLVKLDLFAVFDPADVTTLASILPKLTTLETLYLGYVFNDRQAIAIISKLHRLPLKSIILSGQITGKGAIVIMNELQTVTISKLKLLLDQDGIDRTCDEGFDGIATLVKSHPILTDMNLFVLTNGRGRHGGYHERIRRTGDQVMVFSI